MDAASIKKEIYIYIFTLFLFFKNTQFPDNRHKSDKLMPPLPKELAEQSRGAKITKKKKKLDQAP